MTLNQALPLLSKGVKIKLPEWDGYWLFNANMNVDAYIAVMLATGEIVYTPEFDQYGNRDD